MPHLRLVCAAPQPDKDPTIAPCLQAAHAFLSSLKTGGHILVAVSGGSDSMGLLLSLETALQSGRYPQLSLACCTVDHALRSQSAEEARSVGTLCRSRSIPHETLCWEGKKPRTGVQAAARLARYRLLAQAAQRMHAVCVVTGHTIEDQEETVAMRGRRSRADAPGLAGMAPAVLFDRSVWIVRPFLSVHRADIRAFLTSLGEGWIDDPSNLDRRFERVRTRLEAASNEAAGFGSAGAADARVRSSAKAAGFLSRYVKGFAPLACRVDPAFVGLLQDADARRALLALAAAVGGRCHPVGHEASERIMTFLSTQSPGRLTAGRVVFDKRAAGLFLYREARDLPSITLEGEQSLIWDERFYLANTGRQALHISPVGEPTEILRAVIAGAVAQGLPSAIAKRAVRALFQVDPEPNTVVAATARIALFDTFLPCFDRTIADMLAALFGRDPYMVLPVHDVFTEKQGRR